MVDSSKFKGYVGDIPHCGHVCVMISEEACFFGMFNRGMLFVIIFDSLYRN
jgi:hypothetical protein